MSGRFCAVIMLLVSLTIQAAPLYPTAPFQEGLPLVFWVSRLSGCSKTVRRVLS